MLLLITLSALAHKPSFGPNSSPNDAFLVSDPNISIVLYQEITCEDDQIWISFSAEADFELYVQGGIPEIDRLEDYKPYIAVLAPGLPEVDISLPFEIPEGLGAVVYSPEDSSSDFYEPFTQTSSWVWIEETLTLPESGDGYIVGWNEESKTGKMWLATGLVEDFSDVDPSDFVIWNEYVNNFHETGRFEQPVPKEEQICTTEEDNANTKSNQGCSGNAGALFFLPLMFRMRRKHKK